MRLFVGVMDGDWVERFSVPAQLDAKIHFQLDLRGRAFLSVAGISIV